MSLLQANERQDFKHSSIRKLREEGKIPAVIYGENYESKAIFIHGADFLKTIKEAGRNGIITLSLNNDQHSVMLHDIQKDPLKSDILHADFQVVNMKSEVEVDVNIQLIGDAIGVKDGGVLQQPLHQVSVRALPTNIPTSIDIDVSNLEVGQTISIGDIQTVDKFDINHDMSEVVASVLPPKQEDEINSGEEQETGQPDNVEGRETDDE
ncbi:50S ribosomal protein L25/general stress protein Ctc [Cytobacillus sp. IB215665]|uniref:50S ribosomal protein L25/general stress protein Ctc n=1 Tax=Cytobacillus sp. IB215665 TaxID=3097357 RepID=UPI002A0C2DC0|nr:50S ribosomal protein L25/general stress protein Ctc [Cytobacillus sp. IB215665]MDX8367628.1 50S ribosomal protein L25/general stress protein Ctc [Cytobacillus sp. IB215665]